MKSANDRYEDLAEKFYKKTGMLAPGKDDAPEMHGQNTIEERIKAWDKFIKELPPTGA